MSVIPNTDAAPPYGDAGSGSVSTNVAVDLVDYIRSNTVRNEQQFLLACASIASAFASDTKHFNSFVTIGTAGSGKTHMHQSLSTLLEHMDLYQTTSGSGKSMIYDDAWDDADFAFLDELQKPPQDLIEFLKSVHGGDESFTYKVTTGSTRDGFATESITRRALPYCFLYAQWGADLEMWDRLLKIPIHESESKNKAVGAMSFDHNHISAGDAGVEYGYQYGEGTQTIQYHVASMKGGAPFHVVLPDGTGVHDWDVWTVLEPIFAHGRSEVNRIYSMVANLIRGWTIWNYKSRETIPSADIPGVDDDTTVLVADPQDVANVLSCREVLLGTTHQIDRKKRAVAEAIKHQSGRINEVEGIGPIRDFLQNSDAPTVAKKELENILEALENNYLIEIHEDAGERSDIYEFLGWDELGFAQVERYADLFEHTVDPVKNTAFMTSIQERRDELDTDAQDLLQKASIDASERQLANRGSSSAGQSGGLSDFGGGLEEDAPDLTETEIAVLTRMREAVHGKRVRDLRDVPVEALLGLTPLEDPDSSIDIQGTILDPEHDVWDQTGKSDTWVTSKTATRRQCKQAIDSSIDKGVVQFDEIHREADGQPVDATLAIEHTLLAEDYM